MKVGLVGYAGSGKTTVFNAMTGRDTPVGFGGEVTLGTVRVPDERIDRLTEIYSPKRKTYAEMVFCDVPGEHGAERTGISPVGLQQIRDQDALCLVLRDFPNPALEDAPDPGRDLEAFHAECVLADLDIVERQLIRARKEGAEAGEIRALEAMQATLEEERPLRSLSEAELAREPIKGYGLLSDRPLLVALNQSEDEAATPLPEGLSARIAALGGAGFTLSASVEAAVASMRAEEQGHFLEDLGLAESALDRFIRTAYGLLDLISFITVGPEDVRAWTIRRGTRARRAAGRIHSDLERGFIRAEVIPYEVFMEYGSEAAVRDAGKLQIEGKEYVVRDGDMVYVRFNV